MVLCPSKTTAPRKLEGASPHLPTAPPPLQQNGAWGLWSSHGLCTPMHRPPASLQGLHPPGNASSSRDALPTCAHVQGSSLFQKGSLPFVCLENSSSSFPTHLRCHHFQERPLDSQCRDGLHVFLAIRIVGSTSWGEKSGQGLVPSEATVCLEAKAVGNPPVGRSPCEAGFTLLVPSFSQDPVSLGSCSFLLLTCS